MSTSRREFGKAAATFAFLTMGSRRLEAKEVFAKVSSSESYDALDLEYRHVDVFSREIMSGNGVTVFETPHPLAAELMQGITREMRQYESIFLTPLSDVYTVKARIFTMQEELDFAGHPLLGAAAVLHERRFPKQDTIHWKIELSRKIVPVTTSIEGNHYRAEMDQGTPEFGHTLTAEEALPYLRALNLEERQTSPNFPLQQVTTGLPYLIVPILGGLESARIVQSDFEPLLAKVGAKFVYVFDVERSEGRTWDNQGLVEDIATGSAAGPTGAYLVRCGAREPGKEMVLSQGRFVGRPSKLYVTVSRQSDQYRVIVASDVRPVARGSFGT